MGNQIRTTILLAAMTALIIWIGQLLGGRQGMIFPSKPLMPLQPVETQRMPLLRLRKGCLA